MSLTGLALAKIVLVTVGVVGATGAVAVATENAHGLAMALQHVPTWTHAHNVLTHLSQNPGNSHRP